MQDKTADKFLHLLRFSIGTGEDTPPELTAKEWLAVYHLAIRHAVAGVCSMGIERMADSHRPAITLALHWAMLTIEIEKANRLLNKRTCEAMAILKKDGFDCCLLKGQGAALYYPKPLLRQCGDIDLWVDGDHKLIVRYAWCYYPYVFPRYHHVDFHIYKDVRVELHYRPSWLPSPKANKRLKQWFKSQAKEQMHHLQTLPEQQDAIAMPSTQFNMVFMLLHIYNHFFDEGIGLRQLIDYHYVMTDFANRAEPGQSHELRETLKQLGLTPFARALMYVMHEMLGTDIHILYVEQDANKGRQLLKEVMRAGNFGTSNDNIDRSNGKSMRYFWTKFCYKLHLIRIFPLDTLQHVAFWFYQWLWRKKHGYV